MKKKLIVTIVCLSLILCMSIISSAVYVEKDSATYKRGVNYHTYTGIPGNKKTTDSMYLKMLSRDQTSWSNPYGGIANSSNQEYSSSHLLVEGQTTRKLQWGTSGTTYYAVITGSDIQLGVDTMYFKFDVDAT